MLSAFCFLPSVPAVCPTSSSFILPPSSLLFGRPDVDIDFFRIMEQRITAGSWQTN